MLVEPKGEDSFKQIEDEVEGDPLKKTAGNMTPAVAKVSSQDIIFILQTVSPRICCIKIVPKKHQDHCNRDVHNMRVLYFNFFLAVGPARANTFLHVHCTVCVDHSNIATLPDARRTILCWQSRQYLEHDSKKRGRVLQ